jgi:hypothetical protein
MTRIRLSTIMLLVVIAALSTTLVVEHMRIRRLESERRAELAEMDHVVAGALRLLSPTPTSRAPSVATNQEANARSDGVQDGEASATTFFRLLPAVGRQGHGRYSAHDAFGYSFLDNVFICEYRSGVATWQGFLRPCRDSREAKALLANYIATSKNDGAAVRGLNADADDEMVLSENLDCFDVVFRKGNSFAGATSATDAQVAEAFARELARSLPAVVPTLPSGN